MLILYYSKTNYQAQKLSLETHFIKGRNNAKWRYKIIFDINQHTKNHTDQPFALNFWTNLQNNQTIIHFQGIFYLALVAKSTFISTFEVVPFEIILLAILHPVDNLRFTASILIPCATWQPKEGVPGGNLQLKSSLKLSSEIVYSFFFCLTTHLQISVVKWRG